MVYDQGINAKGRLTDSFSPATLENPAGNHIHYDYEPATPSSNRGLPREVRYTIDGASYSVGLEYDDLARTSRVHYPVLGSGTPIVAQYVYDNNSPALKAVNEVGSGTPKPLWRVDSVSDGYLLQQETFGNGAVASYGYDSQRKWLSSVETTLDAQQIQAIEYTHYDNGQGQVYHRDAPEPHLANIPTTTWVAFSAR